MCYASVVAMLLLLQRKKGETLRGLRCESRLSLSVWATLLLQVKQVEDEREREKKGE